MEPSASLDPLVMTAAFAAGLVSFISPCVLPLVPAYLGFITGLSAEELKAAQGRARFGVAIQGLAFIGGLAAIFAVLGASASLLGQVLLQNLPVLLRLSGVVVILFGLHLLGVLRIPLLYRTARVVEPRPQQGALGAFLLGAAFGAGWTPCVGPFLAGVLALASAEETVLQGSLLLVVYALGLGLPFLLAGLAVDRSLGVMGGLRPHLALVEKGAGVLLVGMGALLFTERFTLLTAWLTRVFGVGLAL